MMLNMHMHLFYILSPKKIYRRNLLMVVFGGGVFVFPNVVNAVELTPNNTIKTVKSIVKLPHCVKRFKGCLAIF